MSESSSAVDLENRQREIEVREIEVVAKATGYGRVQAHVPTGIGRLLVGRHALPENPLHITLDRDSSTSETPKAR